jgi:hypothetical protein
MRVRGVFLFASVGAFSWSASAGAGDPPQDEHTVQSTELDGFLDALLGGKASLSLRYRTEVADQKSFSDDALASTLRTLLGYETAAWHGFTAMIEFENVTSIGDDNYNSTTNGKLTRPVVADPEGTEVNQVWLQKAFGQGVTGRLGRQRITLDNHRFIGNVGWRQNEQTFDAVTLSKAFEGGPKLFYGFLDNVNRVFGDESPIGDGPMASHLLNASYDIANAGKLTGYWYLLDFDLSSESPLSTSTFGARLAGEAGVSDEVDILYAVEAARQSDAGDNPGDVDAGYYLGELGAEVEEVSVKIGYEVFEGDGTTAFATPLATLHAFNGWADKFLGTPPDGLEDLYLSCGADVGKAKLSAVYHDFSAQSGGADYGSEIDLGCSYPVSGKLTAGLNYANYMEDGFSDDTQKLWFWLSIKP